MGKLIFNLLCILMVVVEIIIICVLMHKKDEKLKVTLFIHPLAISSLTIIGYAVSINSSSYFIMSLSNSIYFCTIDILLLMMLDLIILVTEFKMHMFQVVTRMMARIYAIFDCIVLMINPFCEIAIHYVPDSDLADHWIFEPYILYQLHLTLCYIVIVMVTYCLVLKIVITPAFYRIRYSLILFGLLFIVALNCLFLYLSAATGFKYDISVLLYGAMCMLIYYNTFYYSRNEIMKAAPVQIIANLNNPMILFDYEKKLVIKNKVTGDFLKNVPETFTMDELICALNIEDKIDNDTEKTSFQLVHDKKLYRCDFQTLSQKKKLIGYVFSFTEYSTEYDMLTGFHTEAAAMRDFSGNAPSFPAGVLVCDINRLSHINETYGHAAGDQAISSVAAVIRKDCPKDAYFVRMHDAIMMAVCQNTSVPDMKQICKQITEDTNRIIIEKEPLVAICAFSMCTNAQPKTQKAIIAAEETIHVKKMLDQGSAHSSLLFSLARVLQETDPETEYHVMRTRIMGEKLAEKLGLNDEETSNLSLLCLLHDVGKLCIPLEIINKPGKLTKPEWEMLKTHTSKGYQIAKASRELSPLADMILHHHECWDGSGYPGGLAKEEIPLLSRIISIVDAYDAMTNDRPYRKAIGRQAALLEIERCSGTQFDPYIANIFCEMIRSDKDYQAEVQKASEKMKAEQNGSDKDKTDENKSDKAGSYDVHTELPPENMPDTRSENINLSSIHFSRYTLDIDGGHITSADKHFEYMTGYSEDDVESGSVTQEMLIYPEDRGKYEKLKSMLLQRDKEAFIEHRLRMKDGVCRNVCCHVWPYYEAAHKKLGIQIIIVDLTESPTVKNMIESERAIAQHSQIMWKESLRHDPLTGLLNHTAFGNDMQEVLNADDRTSVMLMCDIDSFKQYNDTMGHVQGDELLKSIGRVMTEHVRDSGFVCRMGGDEFAIALFFEKGIDIGKIRDEASALWKGIDNDSAQFGSSISISMGMALSVGKQKNFAQMYDESDQALYVAKKHGKRQLAVFGEEMAD